VLIMSSRSRKDHGREEADALGRITMPSRGSLVPANGENVRTETCADLTNAQSGGSYEAVQAALDRSTSIRALGSPGRSRG
jgi:hypothetical protein